MTAYPRRIPLAGTSELRPAIRRARLVRLLLAAGLVGALAAALALSLDHEGAPSLLPAGSDGVIVLDVSGSIGPREHRQLVRALDEAVAGGRRYGLVVFSDVAYEVFPPGTHAAQIRAIRRFFVPARQTGRRLGTYRVRGRNYLASPWTGSFIGGTVISSGLDLAREIVVRDRLRRPAVLLISDLDYDTGDVGAIQESLGRYQRDGIQLGIVALAPSGRMERFFDTMGAVRGTSVTRPVEIGETRTDAAASASAPLLLGAACLAVLLLLAANELACARLTWRRSVEPTA